MCNVSLLVVCFPLFRDLPDACTLPLDAHQDELGREQQVGEPTQSLLLVDANGCSYTRPLVDGVPPTCVRRSRVCSVAGARIQSVCLLACSLAKGHFFSFLSYSARRGQEAVWRDEIALASGPRVDLEE